MRIAATKCCSRNPRGSRSNTPALVTAAAILVLAVPAAATAKIIPAKRPPAHIAVKKTVPSKAVKRIAKPAAAPRRLCICVWPTTDRAMVQAQADFEARYGDWLVRRGVEPWDWANDAAAVAAFNEGLAALLAGTKTIDQIMVEVDSA